MRPIDGDALIEIVEDGLRNNPHKDGHARVCHRSEYMHFLDVIQRMPTIAPPPNDPLTLDQLREMDGEPVWDVKIKMLETVRPDFPFLLTGIPADTILVCGKVYEATQNKHGAVCGICENGQKLGVKPGEFEIVEEGQHDT